MIPRSGFLRRKFEAALIHLAIAILMGRNVPRSHSRVTPRQQRHVVHGREA